MTNYILIQNRGEFDPLGLELLGASTKRDNPSQIGLFGSGFKYALAWLLRNNQPPRIFSGTTEVHVSTEPVTFRGQDFTRIFINGRPTSLTTDTGPRWQAPAVVREIWANALDEGEAEIVSNPSTIKGAPGLTRVYLEATPEIAEVFDHWDQYFADRMPAIHTNRYGRVLDPSDVPTNIYVRGVWATALFGRFRFSYDLIDDGGLLNEERQLADSPQFCRVFRGLLSHIDRASILKELLLAEGSIELATLKWLSPSSKWADLLSDWNGRFYTRESADLLTIAERENGIEVPPEAALFMRDKLNMRPAGSGHREHRLFAPAHHPDLQQRAAKLVARLAEEGFPTSGKVQFGQMKSPELAALADRRNHRVCISANYARAAGDLELVACLLEEFLHLNEGFSDCSRLFQDYLLETVAAYVMKGADHVQD